VPSPLKEDKIWFVAVLLSIPALVLPLSNPDIFWHLSAGRWMIEHKAWPRADFLSFAAEGRPWLDFEWLFQLISQALYRAGGFGALWILKILLLVEIWLALDATLRQAGISSGARAAALVFWSAGMFNYSDVRPELFSLAFLAVLFYFLESRRICSGTSVARDCVKIFSLFALWSNLHGGFMVGLGVLTIYGLCEAAHAKKWPAAYGAWMLAALAGTLLNPYGIGPYRVASAHAAQQSALSHIITEWLPISLGKPFHWPFFAQLIVFCAAAVVAALRQRKLPEKIFSLPLAAIFCAGGFGIGAFFHARLAAYFAVAAIPAVFLSLQSCGWLSGSAAEIGAWGWNIAYAVFLAVMIPRVSWSLPMNLNRMPVSAANFIGKNRSDLSGLRIYNQWEWGGYLGWKLSPWYKVSSDGRYIFHEQLARAASAASDAGAWQNFMDDEKFNGALIPNLNLTFPSLKRYPDGRTKPFLRPWYLSYMPRERWALVYWDRNALLFVRKDAVSSAWLSRHQYRYVHPFDDAAFAEALKRGEIPADGVADEKKRHQQELAP
jgi:hypothetical protein